MEPFRRKDSPYWWVKIARGQGRKPIQKSTGTTDEKKAKEYLVKLTAELWEQDRLGVRPKRSWQQAVNRYVEEKGEGSASHYTDLVHLRWLDAHLGSLNLDQITPDVLRNVQRARRAFRGKTKDKPTPATVNRCMAFVGRILRKASLQWDWLDKAPMVPALPEPKIRVCFLTEADIDRLLPQAPEHMRPMIEFALETGLRMSEQLGLRWSQVDLANRTAWLHADQTKARKARSVPLSQKAVEIVRSMLGKHETHIFSYRGAPLLRINGRAWRSVRARAGLPEFRWHDLRHTWATRLVMSGASLQELQELGGWESPEMVRRYAHFGGRHLADVQERASKSHALRLVAA